MMRDEVSQIKNSQIRGWCPGVYRPMSSGDGLIIRIRPFLGEINPAQAKGLAGLAEEYSQGFIELTNRANLQLRAINENDSETIIKNLANLSLLDLNSKLEGRRNIIFNPFRCLSEVEKTADFNRLLLEGLAHEDFTTLPAKFGFVVALGAKSTTLSSIRGDIRVEERPGGHFFIRADGMITGHSCKTITEAAHSALTLARWFIASGGIGPDGRGRMATHIAKGVRLPVQFMMADPKNKEKNTPPPLPGSYADGYCLGATFGRLSSAALRFIASEAQGNLRITPFRMVYIAGNENIQNHPDLILDPHDPLWHIHACTGAPSCAQSTVETRDLARQLAPSLPVGISLHISGCSKGCAYPERANITLVGHESRFDLVINGAPWKRPRDKGLTPKDLFRKLGI